MRKLKKNIKKLLKIFFKKKKKKFNSKSYWESRYESNSTSGSGSYGRLALFKASVINKFISSNNVNSVIEMGCGDGNQLTYANYPSYIGLDVSKRAISICKEKFKNDSTKSFLNITSLDKRNSLSADLAISLDVIYHLVEDDVYDDYMQSLFSLSKNYVIIYSSNYEKKKAKHVRCREFTVWINKNVNEDFELIETIKNEFPFDKSHPNTTSMSDFYIYKKIK